MYAKTARMKYKDCVTPTCSTICFDNITLLFGSMDAGEFFVLRSISRVGRNVTLLVLISN